MKGGNERGRTFGSTNYGSNRGNLGGAALKKYSLGVLGNSIAGIVGGGVGGQLLSSLIPALADGIGGQVAGGGIGGMVVMVIVGMIKSAMAKGN